VCCDILYIANKTKSFNHYQVNVQSAVLFLIFNRPDTTQQVFEKIREARPPRLYVAADGPRKNKVGEEEKCRQTRSIIDNINWPCELKTLYRTDNLGCKIAVSEAIDWFFGHEEEGIILEDDCLPDATFFPYCDELLLKYRNDNRIWHIAGFSIEQNKVETSYRFSRLVPIWGWATWRRAWKHYDREMTMFNPDDDEIYDCFGKMAVHVKETFSNHLKHKINTWDTQWAFTCVNNLATTILPSYSLIQNIGFNADATHTKKPDNLNNSITSTPIKFPLSHPHVIDTTMHLDVSYLKSYYPNQYLYKLISIFKSLVK